VVASCVKTGIIFKMRKRYFFMYGHQTFTAPVHPFINNISEGDIKGFVFHHNLEVYKFISAAVDLIDRFLLGQKVEQPCQAGGLCNPN